MMLLLKLDFQSKETKLWQKTALLQAWVVGRLVRLANVPFAGWQRISKCFVRGQKN